MTKHSVLIRQLRRSHLAEAEIPSNLKDWQQFLDRINRAYVDLDNERYLSERSQKISSKEFQSLYDELKDEKKRLQIIFDQITEGIVAIDEQGRIESLNQKILELVGYTPNELIGNNIEMLIPPNLRLPHPANMEQYFTHYKFGNLSIETEVLHQQGYTFPVEVSLTEVIIQQKRHFIWVVRDITERKSAEKKARELNNKLILTARYAGMADVATSVLHNIGNIVNSIGVSVTLLKEKLSQPKWLAGFIEINALIKKHTHDIATYITTDPQGKNLPIYLELLEKTLQNERNNVASELESLVNCVQIVKSTISMQQALGTNVFGSSEWVVLSDLVNIAIKITGFDETYRIDCHYGVKKPIILDQVKLVQILINLFRNAKDALIEKGPQNEKKITVDIKRTTDHVIQIRVIDNGIGIMLENQVKIFSFGFTTKKEGHGYGLHTSALLATEMGGTLRVESNGLNQGAMFILELPYKKNEEIINDE